MELQLSVATSSRLFYKAMRRVRAKLQPLLEASETVELTHPIYEAILVGVTDDKDPGWFKEFRNDNGFFQLIFGCSYPKSEDELTREVFEILQKATQLCPLAECDHASFEHLFARLRSEIMNEHGDQM